MGNPRQIVEAFWSRMQTNDWRAASELFGEDFRLDWPLTSEYFDTDGFVQVNSDYPANGRWTFDVKELICDGSKVVTLVDVSDGVLDATAISFFNVKNDQILSITEYWPEATQPPDWRR